MLSLNIKPAMGDSLKLHPCRNSFKKKQKLSFFPLLVLVKSGQSAFGIPPQIKEDHSSRDLHRRPRCQRSGLAVGRPRWRQWEEREGAFALGKEMQIS